MFRENKENIPNPMTLHDFVKSGNHVRIKLPITEAAFMDYNQTDKNLNTPLHLAVERGYDKWVEFLFSNKAKPNRINKFGLSPLMLAVSHSHPQLVLMLLVNGANVNLISEQGQTALHYAACTGNEDCMRYLLQYKAKLNIQDKEGATPLVLTCKYKKPNMLKMLISHKTAAKANINLCDKMQRSALHWAADLGDEECVKILFAANADMNLRNGDMETPFVRAIKKNNLQVLDILIEAGCDSCDIDGLNGTAMTLAGLLGRTEVIRRLINVGQDVNEPGHMGLTPLISAIFESNVDSVRLLLDNGADPNLSSRMGSTPIIKTCSFLRESKIKERHDIAKLLLRFNADPNIRSTMAGYCTKTTNGRNCGLSFAISCGSVSMAMMYLIGGAKITLGEVSEWMHQNDVLESSEERDVLCRVYKWAKVARSLKFMCRKVIREHLGLDTQTKIGKLPVPKSVQQYIDLEELDDIEIECASIKQSGSDEYLLSLKRLSTCIIVDVNGTLSYEIFVKPNLVVHQGT